MLKLKKDNYEIHQNMVNFLVEIYHEGEKIKEIKSEKPHSDEELKFLLYQTIHESKQ